MIFVFVDILTLHVRVIETLESKQVISDTYSILIKNVVP